MSERNNQRADWANAALDAFVAAVAADRGFIDLTIKHQIGDLLIDLFHLMDRHGIDPDETILVCRELYKGEVEQGGKATAVVAA